MKHKLSAIFAILLFAMPVKAQQVAADSLYIQAYTEIADMLDGKQPLSIKRAVFLSERAYQTLRNNATRLGQIAVPSYFISSYSNGNSPTKRSKSDWKSRS